ncbi:DUF945 family protein [Dongshaea marina]|uniref:DUF945 family protein n=1 Tax=Dongshaea marina TaxID=2047966 RepID=UPI000D3EA073|nr:DUF945 family protein [Dongshaea marina]
MFALISHSQASISLSLPQKLEVINGFGASLKHAVAKGVLIAKDDRLNLDFSYQQGKMSLNGRPMMFPEVK